MEKIKNIYKYIFCIINSLIIIFTLNFNYTVKNVFGTIDDVYLESFKIRDIFVFIYAFLTFLILFYLLDRLLKRKSNIKLFNISNKKVFIITIIVLLICWSPYYLSFFPGGVYSDTYHQFQQVINGIEPTGHAYFYTLLLKMLYYICCKNTTVMFGLMTVIQILLFITSFSYFIVKLKEYKVDMRIIIGVIIFYALYPRFPIYAISLWKDSLYTIFLFLFIIKVFDLIKSNGKLLIDNKYIVSYFILGLLASLFRNNSYIIIVLISIILMIKYKKQIHEYKLFYRINCIFILLLVFGFNIGFNMFNFKTPYKESLSIPLQQISYVVASNKKIDKKSKEYLDNLVGVDIIKNNYYPLIVDGIKKDESFSDEFLENNKNEFWQMYFRLGFKYPLEYLKSYLYITVGYWNYYTCSRHSGTDALLDFNENYPYIKGLKDISKNTNIFKLIFKKDIKRPIGLLASKLNNCAYPFLIMFVCIYILISKKKTKYFIMYLPSIFILVALLIGTPIAFHSRYIIYPIMFIPFSIIIPFIEDEKTKKIK